METQRRARRLFYDPRLEINIDTPEGMARAIAEQEDRIRLIPSGGRWVAWSGSIYVLDQENKRVRRLHGVRPEPDIDRVFVAMGWTVLPEEKPPPRCPYLIA